MLIFLLLSSEDGFQTKWKEDEKGVLRAPAIYNGGPRWRICSLAAGAAGLCRKDSLDPAP